MMDEVIGMMPMLSESTDSLLMRADIMFKIVVPIAIVIMFVSAIFGKK